MPIDINNMKQLNEAKEIAKLKAELKKLQTESFGFKNISEVEKFITKAYPSFDKNFVKAWSKGVIEGKESFDLFDNKTQKSRKYYIDGPFFVSGDKDKFDKRSTSTTIKKIEYLNSQVDAIFDKYDKKTFVRERDSQDINNLKKLIQSIKSHFKIIQDREIGPIRPIFESLISKYISITSGLDLKYKEGSKYLKEEKQSQIDNIAIGIDGKKINLGKKTDTKIIEGTEGFDASIETANILLKNKSGTDMLKFLVNQIQTTNAADGSFLFIGGRSDKNQEYINKYISGLYKIIYNKLKSKGDYKNLMELANIASGRSDKTLNIYTTSGPAGVQKHFDKQKDWVTDSEIASKICIDIMSRPNDVIINSLSQSTSIEKLLPNVHNQIVKDKDIWTPKTQKEFADGNLEVKVNIASLCELMYQSKTDPKFKDISDKELQDIYSSKIDSKKAIINEKFNDILGIGRKYINSADLKTKDNISKQALDLYKNINGAGLKLSDSTVNTLKQTAIIGGTIAAAIITTIGSGGTASGLALAGVTSTLANWTLSGKKFGNIKNLVVDGGSEIVLNAGLGALGGAAVSKLDASTISALSKFTVGGTLKIAGKSLGFGTTVNGAKLGLGAMDALGNLKAEQIRQKWLGNNVDLFQGLDHTNPMTYIIALGIIADGFHVSNKAKYETAIKSGDLENSEKLLTKYISELEANKAELVSSKEKYEIDGKATTSQNIYNLLKSKAEETQKQILDARKKYGEAKVKQDNPTLSKTRQSEIFGDLETKIKLESDGKIHVVDENGLNIFFDKDGNFDTVGQTIDHADRGNGNINTTKDQHIKDIYKLAKDRIDFEIKINGYPDFAKLSTEAKNALYEIHLMDGYNINGKGKLSIEDGRKLAAKRQKAMEVLAKSGVNKDKVKIFTMKLMDDGVLGISKNIHNKLNDFSKNNLSIFKEEIHNNSHQLTMNESSIFKENLLKFLKDNNLNIVNISEIMPNVNNEETLIKLLIEKTGKTELEIKNGQGFLVYNDLEGHLNEIRYNPRITIYKVIGISEGNYGHFSINNNITTSTIPLVKESKNIFNGDNLYFSDHLDHAVSGQTLDNFDYIPKDLTSTKEDLTEGKEIIFNNKIYIYKGEDSKGNYIFENQSTGQKNTVSRENYKKLNFSNKLQDYIEGKIPNMTAKQKQLFAKYKQAIQSANLYETHLLDGYNENGKGNLKLSESPQLIAKRQDGINRLAAQGVEQNDAKLIITKLMDDGILGEKTNRLKVDSEGNILLEEDSNQRTFIEEKNGELTLKIDNSNIERFKTYWNYLVKDSILEPELLKFIENNLKNPDFLKTFNERILPGKAKFENGKYIVNEKIKFKDNNYSLTSEAVKENPKVANSVSENGKKYMDIIGNKKDFKTAVFKDMDKISDEDFTILSEKYKDIYNEDLVIKTDDNHTRSQEVQLIESNIQEASLAGQDAGYIKDFAKVDGSFKEIETKFINIGEKYEDISFIKQKAEQLKPGEKIYIRSEDGIIILIGRNENGGYFDQSRSAKGQRRNGSNIGNLNSISDFSPDKKYIQIGEKNPAVSNSKPEVTSNKTQSENDIKDQTTTTENLQDYIPYPDTKPTKKVESFFDQAVEILNPSTEAQTAAIKLEDNLPEVKTENPKPEYVSDIKKDFYNPIFKNGNIYEVNGVEYKFLGVDENNVYIFEYGTGKKLQVKENEILNMLEKTKESQQKRANSAESDEEKTFRENSISEIDGLIKLQKSKLEIISKIDNNQKQINAQNKRILKNEKEIKNLDEQIDKLQKELLEAKAKFKEKYNSDFDERIAELNFKIDKLSGKNDPKLDELGKQLTINANKEKLNEYKGKVEKLKNEKLADENKINNLTKNIQNLQNAKAKIEKTKANSIKRLKQANKRQDIYREVEIINKDLTTEDKNLLNNIVLGKDPLIQKIYEIEERIAKQQNLDEGERNEANQILNDVENLGLENTNNPKDKEDNLTEDKEKEGGKIKQKIDNSKLPKKLKIVLGVLALGLLPFGLNYIKSNKSEEAAEKEESVKTIANPPEEETQNIGDSGQNEPENITNEELGDENNSQGETNSENGTNASSRQAKKPKDPPILPNPEAPSKASKPILDDYTIIDQNTPASDDLEQAPKLETGKIYIGSDQKEYIYRGKENGNDIFEDSNKNKVSLSPDFIKTLKKKLIQFPKTNMEQNTEQEAKTFFADAFDYYKIFHEFKHDDGINPSNDVTRKQTREAKRKLRERLNQNEAYKDNISIKLIKRFARKPESIPLQTNGNFTAEERFTKYLIDLYKNKK